MDGTLKRLYDEAVRASERLEKEYPPKQYRTTEKGLVLDPNDPADRAWWEDNGLTKWG